MFERGPRCIPDPGILSPITKPAGGADRGQRRSDPTKALVFGTQLCSCTCAATISMRIKPGRERPTTQIRPHSNALKGSQDLERAAPRIGHSGIAPVCAPWYLPRRKCLNGGIVMGENQRKPNQDKLDESTLQTDCVDKGRRAALLNIGALAGAAPAVAVLLTPSASRATGSGGSPCEGTCGTGHGTAPSYKPGSPGTGGDTGFLGKRES